jgi:hypothetical protein
MNRDGDALLEWFRACARSIAVECGGGALRELASRLPLDGQVARGLQAHGLLNVVCRLLEDEDAAGEVPGAAREILQQDAARRIVCGEVLGRIGERFGRDGIPAAAVRAWGRTARAYPDPSLRTGRDVDLLVSATDVRRAEAGLESLGFKSERSDAARNYSRGVAWVDLAGSPVDLVRITGFPEEEKTFPNLCAGWAGMLEPGPCAGIGFLPLAAEFHLNALHAMYKHGFERCIWGLDLLLLSREMLEKDIEALRAQIAESGTGNLVAAACETASRLAEAGFPAPFIQGLQEFPARGIAVSWLGYCANGHEDKRKRYVAAVLCGRSPMLGLRMLGRLANPLRWRRKGRRQGASVR